MIQLSIKKSIQAELIGQVTFFKNLIYIGNNHLCEIYLKDPQIISNHLIIEIAQGKLIVHPHKDVDHFLVNGKRSTGHKVLSVKDLIEIGNTQIQIDNFLETQHIKTKEHLNQITAKLIEEESPLLEVIQKVQELEL